MSDLALSGSELARLINAIKLRFQTTQQLQQLLHLRLDKRFEHIVAHGSNLNDAVYMIVTNAADNGWLRDLVCAAHEEVPVDDTLRELCSASSYTRSAPEKKHNLTARMLDNFIGRAEEINKIRDELSKADLLTLVGAGGIGKTRLARVVASQVLPEYPDGVWFVALVSLSSSASVAQAVGKLFGLRDDPEPAATERLQEFLQTKHLLLVLDNCEHVLAQVRDLVYKILTTSTGVKILATSRQVLNIPSEHECHIPPLSIPDDLTEASISQLREKEAVQLFIDRAIPPGQTFSPTDADIQAIAEICVRLNGLPLAIELAAARMKDLRTPQAILARLPSLAILSKGQYTEMPHHTTIQRTVEWSYTMLDPLEKLLLGRLTVFKGGWTLKAAEQICADAFIASDLIVDVLGSLVDKSLVQRDDAGDGRYSLLEVIRAYAAAQPTIADAQPFAGSDDEQQVRKRHAQYYADFAQSAERHLWEADQADWLVRLDADHENMKHALRWSCGSYGDPQIGLDMASRLVRFWVIRGYLLEGLGFIKSLLGLCTTCPPELRGKALCGAGRLMVLHDSRDPEAADFLQEALDLYTEAGNKRGIARSLHELGTLMRHQLQYDQARDYTLRSVQLFTELDEKRGMGLGYLQLGVIASNQLNYSEGRKNIYMAQPLLREYGDIWGFAWSLYDLAVIERHQGNYAEARRLLEQCLSLFTKLMDRRGRVWAQIVLADVARDQGEYARAIKIYDQSTPLLKNLGDKLAIAWVVQNRGRAAHAQGDYSGAKEFYSDARKRFEELGDKSGVAGVYLNLGRIALIENDLSQATTYLTTSGQLYEQRDHKRGMALVREERAKVAMKQNDYVGAIAHLRESLAAFYELREQRRIASTLEWLSSGCAMRGEPIQAIHLLAAATSLRQKLEVPLSPSDQTAKQQLEEKLRGMVGAAVFEETWERGATMPLEQVIDYTRSDITL